MPVLFPLLCQVPSFAKACTYYSSTVTFEDGTNPCWPMPDQIQTSLPILEPAIAAYFTRRSRKIILTLTSLWLLLYGSFTLFRPPLLDDADSVHAEGPFGVLDAQGFTVMDKGAAIDFPGPAHLVLNGTDH